MKCSKCGKKNSQKDEFCENCGHKLKGNIKKITIGLILSWIFGILFLFVGIGSIAETPIIGLLIILCSIMVIPYFNKIATKHFHFEISKGIKAILIIVILVLAGYGLSKSSTQQLMSSEIKGLTIPKDSSPCDFLPDKDIIPSEYKISDANEENNSCTQQYYQPIPMSTRFSITIHKFDLKEDCNKEYLQTIEKIKAERGFSELKTKSDQCFAINKEKGLISIAELYCNWGYILFEETISNVDGYNSDILLSKIPQNVVSKIETASLDI